MLVLIIKMPNTSILYIYYLTVKLLIRDTRMENALKNVTIFTMIILYLCITFEILNVMNYFNHNIDCYDFRWKSTYFVLKASGSWCSSLRWIVRVITARKNEFFRCCYAFHYILENKKYFSLEFSKYQQRLGSTTL